MKNIMLLMSLSLIFTTNAYTPKEFKLDSYDKSAPVELKNLNDKKILINFWATWCTSCIEEIPILHKLKVSKNAKDYHFIAISAGDSRKKIKKFIRRHKFNYKILMDKDNSLSKSWGVEALPVTIILDKERKIIYEGIRPPKTLP
ncbi:TlpA family protein disulfide reductase [Halobacteriovorax sp.]|uniref:TlpA family protein disulfide reductase n=1 Tax=Halobacteriovorax sp. TaxID=2020862 RepID=UPI003562344E